MALAASDAAAGNGSLPPPAPPTTAAQGPECSPQSGRRGGAGAAGATSGGQGGATKTIQSYFFKPSNGSGVQALAASYASGEIGGGGIGGGGEVDLSGVDDKWDGESVLSHGRHRSISRIGRNGSAGGANGGNAVGSLQHRFSSAAASAATDQGVGQGHNRRQDGLSTAGGAGAANSGGARVDEKVETQAGRGQESIDILLAKLRDSEALAKRLRKELERANLERGSMETVVSRWTRDAVVS